MADAKKCDRCGDFYELREPDPVETLVGIFSHLSATWGLAARMESLVDLCPKCSRSLKKWAAKGAGEE